MVLKTNRILLAAALLCSVSGLVAQAAEIETNTARMQAMDKITGKVSEIDVPVNSPVEFGSFSVLVRKCVTRTPEETPENTAFVDVVDNYNSKEPINIFKGWMLSSSPALNAVEHPIYDVWLLKCYDKDRKDVKKLSDEELRARDEIKMVRTEQKTKVAAPETAATTNDSELDTMVKETIASEPTAPADETHADVVQAEVVEVVVSTPEAETDADSDAPQALFTIQSEPSGNPSAAENNDGEADAPSEEKTVEPEENFSEFEDENGYTEEDEETEE